MDDKPDQAAIDEQINRGFHYRDSGQSACGGMSYEEGVLAALQWVLGETDVDEPPIEEVTT